MSILFDPFSIGSLKIRNRFIRSATQDWLAESDGRVSEAQRSLYKDLAAGGVGLIISGHAAVALPVGRASSLQNAISDEKHIEGYRKLADAVHVHGAKLVVQLAHAGCQTNLELTEGQMPLAPSDLFDNQGKQIARAMTAEDISQLVDQFAAAAMRAKRAGADGVQIHMAHGYLLAQFLSPWSNQRTDEYGGSAAGRTRLLAEVVWRVREAVGRQYPVLVKLNSTDGIDAAYQLSLEDVVFAAQVVADHGADAIEISGGTGRVNRTTMAAQGILQPEQESYFAAAAAAVKAKVSIPVLLVGGNRSVARMEAIVQGGIADCISLSRPFVREPDLVNRLAGGQAKASCISCNACFNPQGLKCRFNQ